MSAQNTASEQEYAPTSPVGFSFAGMAHIRTAAELLAHAKRRQVEKSYPEAAQLCYEAFDRLAAKTLDVRLMSLLQNRPWPEVGARIIRVDGFLRTEIFRKSATCEESLKLIDYMEGLVADLVALRPEDFLCLFTRKLANRVAAWNLSPDYKNTIFRVLAPLDHYGTALATRELAGRDSVTHIVSYVLREPYSRADHILKQHRYHGMISHGYRCLFKQHPEKYRRYLETRFTWRDRTAYQRFIAMNTGSRVLLTIHMGDFVGAFYHIARLSNEGRETFVLRREQHDIWSEEGSEYGKHLNQRILRHGQYNPISIVAALRKGNASLCTYFDLNAGFGETQEVTFFGEKARFVKGPVELAIVGRAPIIPFFTYRKQEGNVIEMESALETQVRAGETLADATTRLLQELVNLAERWIRPHPEQWQFLHNLPRYFAHPSTAQPEASATGG